MLLKPFLQLLVYVLAWAVIPATAIYLWQRLARRTARNASGYVIRRWFNAYFLLCIPLGWSTLFLFLPLLKSFCYSFTDKTLAAGATTSWVGFQNYSQLISDPLWWKSIAITMLYIAGTLPYSVLVCLFLANIIVQLPERWQTFFKAALYLPGVTSTVVSAAILKWIFYPGDGFANLILRRLHLIGENLAWFSDPRLALPALIIMTWLGTNGLGVVIYCAALGNIPKDYYEAADVDGASPWTKFFLITCPLVKSSTLFVVITGLIGGFQIFAPALLITAGGPRFTTHFVNYAIYKTFYYGNQFGMASAMSVVLMGVILLVSAVSYKLLASDVEY